MQLNPGNAFASYAYLETPDPLTGEPVPLTVAPGIVARLAISDAVITPAAPALEVAITHVGIAGSIRRPLGTWLILFGADVVTQALCDPLFGATKKAYLVVVANDKVLVQSEVPCVMRQFRVVA